MPRRRTRGYELQTHPDPIRAFCALVASGGHPVWLWMSPEREVLVAWGSRAAATLPPDARWREALPGLIRDLAGAVARARNERPTVLFRSVFDPAAASTARWDGLDGIAAHVPAGLYRRTAASETLSVHATEEEGRDALARWTTDFAGPSPRPRSRGARITDVEWNDDAYSAAVSRGVRALIEGKAAKVVLARTIDVRASGVALSRVLRELRRSYPGCFLVAVAVPGRVFVSATPERLARVANGVVSTVALAGSSAGPHDGASLRTAKNLDEHAIVVRMIRRTLAPLCTALHADGDPSPLELGYITHLRTRITGTLKPGVGIADCVARLHPTPAVCGQPRAAALGLIRRIEGFDRGLYAGVTGWCDASGDGDAAVALRSALITDDGATLFAGAGIMKESRVDDELRETHAKARAVLDAL